MHRLAKSVVPLALIAVLTIAVSLPAAAAETSSPVEGWTDWLGSFWSTITETLDGLAGELVPIGESHTDEMGGEIIPIGQATSGSHDELGPFAEPFGEDASGGQDEPGGQDEMFPLIDPDG